VRFEQILIEPAYRKVAVAIGERILSRTLREGERLPPETELARQFRRQPLYRPRGTPRARKRRIGEGVGRARNSCPSAALNTTLSRKA